MCTNKALSKEYTLYYSTKQIISTWDRKTNSALLHKTTNALQKRLKTENTEIKDKWDMSRKEQRMKWAVGGGYSSTFLSVLQTVDRKCLTIRWALVKIPPSSLQPLPPSLGRAEKLAQADLAHGIDLRRCFFLKATPWKKRRKRDKGEDGRREKERMEIQYTGMEEMNILYGGRDV